VTGPDSLEQLRGGYRGSNGAKSQGRELGIRTALGARPLSLLMLPLFQGLRLAGWGLAIGVAGALGIAQLMNRCYSASVPRTLGSTEESRR
jgi:ABC-type lipoprotein release transport system permease subunit